MGPSNQGTLFFSNSIEVLFEFLKTNLFTASTPFSKRLLILPNRAVEGWIRLRLADDLKISCGITAMFLNEAVEKLTETHFPGGLELTLRIDLELRQILLNPELIWEPILGYVRGKERRRIQLAKHLAQLFTRSRIYGGLKGWQEALWNRMFKDWEEPLLTSKFSDEVHLFGFNHLSPLHFNFFKSGFFYQLSPCQEFWSDGTGDNSLLHELGHVGREMARQIEASRLTTHEAYLIPQKHTQLSQLQSDLLFLRKPEKIFEDDSIQVHSSTTPHREIQNLHQTLLSIMKEEGVEPKDIAVMAPNIALYEPYIRAVFERYQIADMPLRKNHPLYQGLFLLLNLDRHRWSGGALLELFTHPLFNRWSESELAQIRAWIRETGIRWGLDATHRDELLKQNHFDRGMKEEGATWKEGIDHLLEELAIPHEPKRIEFTQAELLGELIVVLRDLYEDLLRLQEEKTLREWMRDFKRLMETYFGESASLPAFAGKEKYSFPMVEMLLKEWLGERTTTINPNQLQAIRFSSIRAIPAKVICLIGMNHSAYPRQDPHFLKKVGPSRADSDRYLFLETLLSARERVILSYLGRNSLDLTEEPPSSVISELLPFVSTVVTHPARSYDPHYFDHSDPMLKNSSQLDFQMLQKPKKEPFFIQRREEVDLPTGEIVVDINDLVRCVRSPLRHYFYHTHGVLWREEEEILHDEAFTLSPLRRAILRKGTLKHAPEQVFLRAKREKDFPIGVFGKIAQKQLMEELVPLPKLNSIEIEPLSISLSKDLTVILTGKVGGLKDDALFVADKANFRNAVKAWPLFLASDQQEIVFMDKSKRRFFGSREPYLRSLLEYYFLSLQMPSPLSPDWVESILKEDATKLKPHHWFLNDIDPHEVVKTWHPQAEKLFKEMSDAWF